MNKLILAIILVLLLSPSMALAEEQQPPSFSDEERKDLDNVNASYHIGHDMFQDVYREYGHNYRLSSFFKAFGYDNLAEEVLEDVPSLNDSLTVYYKYENKYKHHLGTAERYFSSVQVLKGVVVGYNIGFEEALKLFAREGMVEAVPGMYEDYLEAKKEKQLKQDDNQADRKEER